MTIPADFLRSAKDALKRCGANLTAAAAILNDLHGPALKVHAVGTVAVISRTRVVLTVHGRLAGDPAEGTYVNVGTDTIGIRMDKITAAKVEAAAKELEKALARYAADGDGAYVWVVPDGYLAGLSAAEKQWEKEGGGYFSHESICIQNTGARTTRCELTVYFEAPGREARCHAFKVEPHRSIHLRLDKIKGTDGEPFIPKDAPVGYKLISRDAPVVVQGSRILTSGRNSEFASFGTTLAWSPR